MALVCFFYLMVNLALFAACTTEELLSSTDVLQLFFTKVFGPSDKTRGASAILLCISSAGNVMSVIYATVRVKQEIARMGIPPCPGFWAKDTRLDTPGPALFLHALFTVVLIIATPLDSINGYLVISTLFNYARTIIAIYMGIVIIFAHRLPTFRSPIAKDIPWTPQGSSSRIGKAMIYPLAIIYVLSNVFVFVVSWFPANLDRMFRNQVVVSSYVGPAVVMACFGAGALYWVWDLHVLPYFGYTTDVLQERRDGLEMHMTFERRLTGRSARIWAVIAPWFDAVRQWRMKYHSVAPDVRNDESFQGRRSR